MSRALSVAKGRGTSWPVRPNALSEKSLWTGYLLWLLVWEVVLYTAATQPGLEIWQTHEDFTPPDCKDKGNEWTITLSHLKDGVMRGIIAPVTVQVGELLGSHSLLRVRMKQCLEPSLCLTVQITRCLGPLHCWMHVHVCLSQTPASLPHHCLHQQLPTVCLFSSCLPL